MQTTIAYIFGIIILIVGIGLSVALHELGHMIPAKCFGVKVPEYFIGFGPKLCSIRRGETEYGIKAIWLGGYVKLLGMIPPAKTDHPDKPNSMIARARAESLGELAADEQDRAFYRLSVPRKLLVMAGGILTNLVLGILLIAIALGVVGQPTYTSTISTVAACVSEDIDATTAQCTDADAISPAAAAGLKVGDEIISWNGTATSSWTQVQELIASGGTAPATVVVKRSGQELTLSVSAVLVERTVYNPDGTIATDAQGQTQTQLRPYVGISPTAGSARVPVGEIVGEVSASLTQTLKAIVTIPAGLYHAVAAGLGLQERDAQGLVSLVGVGRIAGEVSSAGASVPLSTRVFSMLWLLGSLNLALFAFNLIPLLPLDGGHVAGACWEGIKRVWARATGRRDPGYADTAKLLPLGQVVFVVLIAMAAILIWVDLVAPI